MDFLCLCRRSGLAGANSPNGFVSQDNLGEVLSREGEYGSQLGGNHLVLLVGFALFQHLADAEDGLQTVGQGQFHLLGQDFHRLVVVSTTLGVTQDDVLRTRRSYHGSRNLARVGAGFLVGTVLSTYANLGGVNQRSNRCQVDERRADDDVAIRLFVSQHFVQFFCQSNALLEGLVHFPVSCNNVLSHTCFYLKGLVNLYFFFSASRASFSASRRFSSRRFTTARSKATTSVSGTKNHRST